MAKGGSRTGAGRKSKWSTGRTINIRVPEHLAVEVMAYAQQLDRQRAIEARQQHLMSLLEEYVKISSEEREAWMQTLPEALQQVLQDDQGGIEISRKSSEYQMIYPVDPEQPDAVLRPGEKVKLETLNISRLEALLIASTCGHRWIMSRQNGRLVVDLPGAPQEDVSFRPEQGVNYLEISSKWEVSCLLPQNQSS